jgi:drug/metabolite transporter (DMT)-like permease
MLAPYLIFQIASLTGAGGQALYKVSADRKRNGSTSSHIAPLFMGVVVYLLTLTLFSIAFSYGGQLGPLYASYSTTFIWSLILGRLVWNESMNKEKIAGIIFITGGIYCVTSL